MRNHESRKVFMVGSIQELSGLDIWPGDYVKDNSEGRWYRMTTEGSLKKVLDVSEAKSKTMKGAA